eukprot:2014652-Pleurochrysis_carterae.AAC.1
MVTDRLFQLELSDLKRGPNEATRAKGAWRRGLGCARLVRTAWRAPHGPPGYKDEHGCRPFMYHL